MVRNLSQTGNTSSPSANMLSFGTPSGLGIEGMTPAGLQIHTPALGGAAMMPTMSELGLTTSGGKRNEDEERRTKMRKVLRKIGMSKGRVSEEGIARVSRRVGFANDIDAEKLTAEEKERKVGNRPISTAGNTIVIEVDLKNQVPQNVQVMYSVQSKALEEQGEKAGKVLLGDLKAADGVALNAKLDRFAANLERLARLDRLSSGGVNCFEALSGLYSSLRTLYEHEKAATTAGMKGSAPDIEEKADTEVLRKKSGKPVVHERNRLGVEILYWHESRQADSSEDKASGTKMEVDGRKTSDGDTTATQDSDTTFALRMEAESSPAGLYPSIRVADTWLPDPLELPSADSGEGIPWQEPPPTFIAPDASQNAMAVDGQQHLPDLRFVAKLDPPLVMPYQTALNVLAAVGAPQPQTMTIPPQYAALLLRPEVVAHGQPGVASFTTSAEQDVLSQRDGQETVVRHNYILDSVKLDWGFKVEELPFSHPRQLIELLPTLRQWACVGSLLKATFNRQVTPSRSSPSLSEKIHTHGVSRDPPKLDDLLQQSHIDHVQTQNTNSVPVNIALATAPTPTLGLIFPTLDTERIANISVQILPNADFAISTHEGILPSGPADDRSEKARKMARALEVCGGDLGLWIEWLRTTSLSSS